MARSAAERIAELLRVGGDSEVVQEFAGFLCRRWGEKARAVVGRDVADACLADALGDLVAWAVRKGLLPGGETRDRLSA
jgi:hypothetical protein